MANKKSVKRGASNTGNRNAAATKKEQDTAGRNQLFAILMFALSVFFLFVVLIPGGSLWLDIHNALFGLFGVCTYVFPVMIGLVAVLGALDKLSGGIGTKLTEGAVLVFLIDAAVDLFTVDPSISFKEHIAWAWENGVHLKTGGFFGALISHPLNFAFTKTGALVTVFILIFVLALVITGTTLIGFFKAFAKPVKRMERAAVESYNERRDRDEERDSMPRGKRKKVSLPPKIVEDGPDIDISLTDEEQREREKATAKQKKDKLIDLYNNVKSEDTKDAEEPEQDIPMDEVPLPTEADAPAEPAAPVMEKSEPSENQPEEMNGTERGIDTVEFVMPAEEVPAAPAYHYPPLSLLNPMKAENNSAISNELESTGKRLVEVLQSFGVETQISEISRGPAVTRYELKPSAGVKISKITNLADDIALNLAASGVRIEAPIPNKAAVGIEVPNKNTSMVGVREIIDSKAFVDSKSKLTVALGKDIAGDVTVTDIAKMPHGLIAGATGSGKSVCINSIIISLLYKATPDEVKFLLIDPKVVELGMYNGIPHLLVPVVTDPRKAAGSLGWAVQEMERRYRLFAENDVRNLEGYNGLAEHRDDLQKLPQIVIIIDELADLMMTAPGDVEDAICRIAQKARAAGMHLIVATQRPSVDVVTGLIKANIPTRIAFSVSSQIDSRTILDIGGAEKLMGRGDMLFYPVGAIKPIRIQGCFVSDKEIEDVVDFIKKAGKADYDEEVALEIERLAAQDKHSKNSKGEDVENGDDADPMLFQAIEVVVEVGQASTSLLQRRLKLGYSRAARIIDQMEARGVVDGYQGAKPRNVLLTKEQFYEMKMKSEENGELL